MRDFPAMYHNYLAWSCTHPSMRDFPAMYHASMECEKVFEWRKWTQEIPFISFPSCLQVQVIPPFGSAVVRFCIKYIPTGKTLSCYLDCYNILGWVGQPYWEIYPYHHDTFRCMMKETDKLIAAILEEFERKQEGKNDEQD